MRRHGERVIDTLDVAQMSLHFRGGKKTRMIGCALGGPRLTIPVTLDTSLTMEGAQRTLDRPTTFRSASLCIETTVAPHFQRTIIEKHKQSVTGTNGDTFCEPPETKGALKPKE